MQEISRELIGAVALFFIFEGILPFLSPSAWRVMLLNALRQYDVKIRLYGLCSMLLGVVILNLWY